VADIGPEAVPDLNESQRLQGFHRFAQRIAGDPQHLHQHRLGGHGIAGAEPVVENILLDLVLDPALVGGGTRPRRRYDTHEHHPRGQLAVGPCCWSRSATRAWSSAVNGTAGVAIVGWAMLPS